MLQIQHFPDFIFEDHWPVNDYASINDFQALNFCSMHVINKKIKIYVPRKFVRVWYVIPLLYVA